MTEHRARWTAHPAYRARLLIEDVRAIEAEILIRETELPDTAGEAFLLGYRAATHAALEEITGQWATARVRAQHNAERVAVLDADRRRALAIVDGEAGD